MIDFDSGELRVVVPVGFLLSEEQEVSVTVDRPDGGSLPIRLRLIPARVSPSLVNERTPVTLGWPTRRLAAIAMQEDGYPEPDYGGGD
ncbi:MAG: hypothetical protein K8U57_25805 [Planctomycetes bacterium]|nr:hypothetical protein [Planctomycetota bacterium]